MLQILCWCGIILMILGTLLILYCISQDLHTLAAIVGLPFLFLGLLIFVSAFIGQKFGQQTVKSPISMTEQSQTCPVFLCNKKRQNRVICGIIAPLNGLTKIYGPE